MAERIRALGAEPDVEVILDDSWSTDRITAEGREKLRQAGFAPPAPREAAAPKLVQLRSDAFRCPYCGSSDTRLDKSSARRRAARSGTAKAANSHSSSSRRSETAGTDRGPERRPPARESRPSWPRSRTPSTASGSTWASTSPARRLRRTCSPASAFVPASPATRRHGTSPSSHAALYESVAAHSRLGLNVASRRRALRCRDPGRCEGTAERAPRPVRRRPLPARDDHGAPARRRARAAT